MRLLAAAALLLLGACSWSNSLYQARRLSSAAAKAEREERNFDAGSLWGQVAVKADTAFARNPDGADGAEALWLRGRALAHLGDCPSAVSVLERALVAEGSPDWSDDLRLELARCRSLGEDYHGALQILEPIVASASGRLQDDARQLAGRVLVRAGRWDEALTLLADDDSRDGRWERTIALAELGRSDEALEQVEERIEVSDSLADWDRLVRITATRSPGAVDRLLERLGSMRTTSDDDRSRWLLLSAEANFGRDDTMATRRLEALMAMPDGPAVSRGRIVLVDRRVAAIADSASLTLALDDLSRLVRGDATAGVHAERLARWGRLVQAGIAAHPSGSAEGDLAMFFQAGVARDTLHASGLAAWLLGRLERGWPESPYAAKALLARMPLQPDSAAVLRSRLASHAGSPYLEYLHGTAGPRFAALEDSLDFYIQDRLAEFMAGGLQDIN